MSKSQSWGGMEGGTEGERETREEIKCNRGFIVCGSTGRERSERRGKGSRTRGVDKEEGDSGNSALAEARMSGRPAQSACRLGPSYQTSRTVIQLMLLRRKPAHWVSNSYGKRLNTVQ